ncbi:unnamed protein product [Durusdinium trenchii]|uniref:TFIIS N-terminal domain-containing protein n=1 Tax=Durusdinium trenchii TaxID=1381693 RepID=A0ABP0NBS4_9DINO
MPKRRETEATRRRRAQLAKYRQGPNGKWESNAKKAVAIRVKRQSLRIGPLLASCKAKKVALEARNFQAALRLVKDLRDCSDEACLQSLIGEISSLSVTAPLLRRTLIPKVLREVSARFPNVREQVTPIIAKWRAVYAQEEQRVADRQHQAPRRRPTSSSGSSSSSSSSSTPEVVRMPQTPGPSRRALKQRRITFFLR